MQKPELLSPVSDFISLNAAIQSGADAVYFGLKKLNMRATAKNFKTTELKKVTTLCHKNKVRAFLTLNTIIYDNEINELKKILKAAKQAKINAIICWDHSVIKEARKLNLEVHISTQASVSNTESAKFYKSLGAKRIVMARELSLEQIKKIKKDAKIEVECFIHGAMCVSVSGRCFLSQFTFGKSANRGDCLQPCRRTYTIQDQEENFNYKVDNNNILSPSDLCTLEFIDKLIEAKIEAFKIEGRARSPEYVATVTKVYRTAIDAYFKKKLTKELKQELLNQLKEVYNRGFGKGFYLGKPLNEWTSSDSKSTKKKIYIGYILNYYPKQEVAEILPEAGNLKLGDKIIIQGPTTGSVEQTVSSMQIEHSPVNFVKKGQRFGLKLTSQARRNDKIYLIVDSDRK